MCGIAGLVRTSYEPDSLHSTASVVSRMCARLKHRGPDSEGVYADDLVGLGHARLSIVDIKTGDQPLSNEDGSVQLVCNGEIYNYRELRDGLRKRGHRFKSGSDCEVLVHLYEEVGEDLPKHLIGMFALAIWDAPRRTLLLARDRLGQKPLYYSAAEGPYRFVFASELKALAATSDRQRRLAPRSVATYLSLGYVPDPDTIYADVHKLPPASCLSLGPQGAPRVWRYWAPSYEIRDVTLEEAGEELRALLADSVRLRLMADVPIGAFLSGGVDSCATAGEMADQSLDLIHTYSIGFEDPAFDERPYARRFAETINSRHREDLLKPTPGLLERFANTFDEPFGDSSALPTLRVSELARSEATVALSGDGADEVFGGYERYSRELLKQVFRSALPSCFRAELTKSIGGAQDALDITTRAGRLRAGLTDIADLASDSYFRAMASFHDRDLSRLLAPELGKDLDGWTPTQMFRRSFDAAAHLPLLSQLQACDFEFYLPGDILTKVDRASMAHSLEVRSPWLDHRIVDFGCRLPPALKAGLHSRKRVVRSMLRGRVPKALLQRRKQGFAVPAGRWLHGELSSLFDWVASRPEMEELVRPDRIRQLRSAYEGSEGRAAKQLWHLFALSLWSCRHRHPQSVDWELATGRAQNR